MHQREIRLALLRNGHLPIPVQGKRPLLQNWQNLDPDEEMIARWGDQGDNTGVLCRRTAALDIDFDDAAAFDEVRNPNLEMRLVSRASR
jgi:Bifunctional DNA primase/polymerase, N-terminal